VKTKERLCVSTHHWPLPPDYEDRIMIKSREIFRHESKILKESTPTIEGGMRCPLGI